MKTIRKSYLFGAIGGLCMLPVFMACNGKATDAQSEKQEGIWTEARPMNPIVPEGVYIADPEVRQMPSCFSDWASVAFPLHAMNTGNIHSPPIAPNR